MTEARTALVTGASRGIGFGIALRLAEEGFRTAIVGRDNTRIQSAAKEITEISGTQALAVVGDVSLWSDCLAAVEKVVKEFGAIDVLVPNAGIGIIGSVTESDPADWAMMMQTNYLGTAHIVKAALPIMQKQGSGDVIKLMTFLSISDSPEMRKFFEEELTPANATSGRWKQEISSPEFAAAYEALEQRLNSALTD
jgi:3-oxoacyl-[acyl-carrier protein] reductase